jgi:hypothetical protein
MGVDAEGFWVEMGLLPELLGVSSVIACVEDPPPAAATAAAASSTALTTTAGGSTAKPPLLLHMRRCPDTESQAPAHVHLLLRRGHYDLLYPRVEQWQAGEELVTGAKETASHSSGSSSAKGSPSTTSTKAAAAGGGSSGSSSSAVNGRSSSSSSSEQHNGFSSSSSSRTISGSSQRAAGRADRGSHDVSSSSSSAAAAGAYGSTSSSSSTSAAEVQQGWRRSSRQLAQYLFEAPVVTNPRGFASAAELEQKQLNSSSNSSSGVYAAGYDGVGGWAGSGVRGLLRAGCELDVAGARRADEQYAWLQHEGRMWQQVLLSPG